MSAPGDCPPVCDQLWIATKTYVAQCPAGMTGGPISVTRQGRSNISFEHAEQLAYELAKAEAEADQRCHWESEACVAPNCGGTAYVPICRTGESQVSLEDAAVQALALATEAALWFCLTPFIDSESEALFIDSVTGKTMIDS